MKLTNRGLYQLTLPWPHTVAILTVALTAFALCWLVLTQQTGSIDDQSRSSRVEV